MQYASSLHRTAQAVCSALLAATGVSLIALQQIWGWWLLVAATLALGWCTSQFRRDFGSLCIALALLGITRIDTDIAPRHMIEMGVTLGLAIIVPYAVSRYIAKDNLVRFPFGHRRRWLHTEVLYVFVAAAIAYLLLPFYLRTSGATDNWTVVLTPSALTRLFIGTNALGLWDELFFVSTVLGVLRRFLPFAWANVVQAILFTSFLFELGFTGWGPLMIFPFALLQGAIFRRTESLLYIVTIHLTVDLVLYLALIHAHHPGAMPMFFT